MKKLPIITAIIGLSISVSSTAQLDAALETELAESKSLSYQQMDEYKRAVAQEIARLWTNKSMSETVQDYLLEDYNQGIQNKQNKHIGLEPQVDLMAMLGEPNEELQSVGGRLQALRSIIAKFDEVLSKHREYDSKHKGFTQMTFFAAKNGQNQAQSLGVMSEDLNGKNLYFSYAKSNNAPMKINTDKSGKVIYDNKGNVQWVPVKKGQVREYELFDTQGSSRIVREDQVRNFNVLAVGLNEHKTMLAEVEVANKKAQANDIDAIVIPLGDLSQGESIASDVSAFESIQGFAPSSELGCKSSHPCKRMRLDRFWFSDISEGLLRGSTGEFYIIAEGYKSGNGRGGAEQKDVGFYYEGVAKNTWYKHEKNILDYCGFGWRSKDKSSLSFLEHDDSAIYDVLAAITSMAINYYFGSSTIVQLANEVIGGKTGIFKAVWHSISGGEDDLVDVYKKVYFNNYSQVPGYKGIAKISMTPRCAQVE